MTMLFNAWGCSVDIDSKDQVIRDVGTADAIIDGDATGTVGEQDLTVDSELPDTEFRPDVSPPDAQALQDAMVNGPCAGQPEGALIDQCGVCDTDPDNDCAQDCAGEWGGMATRDNCDVCDTDPDNDCAQDCAGEWGGMATRDTCDVCDTDPDNDCAQDCAGELGGTAMRDNCGVCDTDPSNDCTQDCAGHWGGMGVSDDCGVCDAFADNDHTTCEVPPLQVYMDPSGDDENDGESSEQAVLSLARVNAILTQLQPRRPVEVVIGLGSYVGQRVNWTYIMPNHGITFTRPEGLVGRPIFDGCRNDECLGGTWFQIQSSTGEPTRLSFLHLRIQNYGTAMSFNGNRNDAGASNGGNRVYGCYFSRIGNISNPELNPSTAVIRFVNSDDNIVANSHFVDVINTRSSGLLHSLYIAHMSDRNRIERNRFVRNSGDPVRLRDFSNDNIINDNRFIQSGIEAGYTDWYCDHDARDDCTKPEPECPSWNNQFRNNELDGDYLCGQLGTFHYFQGEQTTGCTPPTPEARRLRTSNNEQIIPGCQGE
jgi:hypothetical protein